MFGDEVIIAVSGLDASLGNDFSIVCAVGVAWSIAPVRGKADC